MKRIDKRVAIGVATMSGLVLTVLACNKIAFHKKAVSAVTARAYVADPVCLSYPRGAPKTIQLSAPQGAGSDPADNPPIIIWCEEFPDAPGGPLRHWQIQNPDVNFADVRTNPVPPDKPDPQLSSREYDIIHLHPADQVQLSAHGCAQAGGHGKTWHQILNTGDSEYYATISAPLLWSSAVLDGPSAGVPLSTVIKNSQGQPDSQKYQLPPLTDQWWTSNKWGLRSDTLGPYLTFRIGFVDDDPESYIDNGYYAPDDGEGCRALGNAVIDIVIQPYLQPPPEKSDVLLANFAFPNAQQILSTDNRNANPGAGPATNWGAPVCGGGTFLLSSCREWNPYASPEIVDSEATDAQLGVASGWLSYDTSDEGPWAGPEFPFNHPFGGDWNAYIVTDPFADAELTLNNAQPAGGADGADELVQAIANADAMHIPNRGMGVLGMEIDQGLVAKGYEPQAGDRVLAFGRRIIDCGHNDFHSEIHMPLVLASAASYHQGELTKSRLFMRPFGVEDRFQPDSDLDICGFQHLISEGLRLCGGLIGLGGLCTQSTVNAYKNYVTPPFSGRILRSYYLAPTNPRRSPTDQLLVNHTLVYRPGVSVSVSPGQGAHVDQVLVQISLDEDAYRAGVAASAPMGLPTKADINLTFPYLETINDKVGYLVDALIGNCSLSIGSLSLPLVICGSVGISYLRNSAGGISMYTYDNIDADRNYDNTLRTFSGVDPGAEEGFPIVIGTERSNMVWPVYGNIDVYWERAQSSCGAIHDTCNLAADCCAAPALDCRNGSCCGSSGATCNEDTDCCGSELACTNHQCRPRTGFVCQNQGQICGGNSDCCAGSCIDLICQPPTSQCAGQGGRCISNGDCCSDGNLSCLSGRCAPPPAPQCALANQACHTNADCCAGFGLGCQSNGAGGTTCQSSAPTCKAAGGDCTGGDDGACCAGLVCGFFNGDVQKSCRPGTPSCGQLGVACAVDGECCGGFVCRMLESGSVCAPPVTPSCALQGIPCAGDGDCCNGLSCQHTTGNRRGNFCEPPPPSPPPPPPSCAVDGGNCNGGVGCCTGLVCSGGVCSPRGSCAPLGHDCSVLACCPSRLPNRVVECGDNSTCVIAPIN